MSTPHDDEGPAKEGTDDMAGASQRARNEPTRSGEPMRSNNGVAFAIVGGVAFLLLCLVGLYLRSAARTNHEALASLPKPVSTVTAKETTFRPSRSYVATLQPWTIARIGPQFVSAYIGTVLVRPGASVRRGEVLATLDCRESSEASRETAARARAVGERQSAAEHEAARLKELTAGGFASPNEMEQLAARSKSQAAEVDALKATLANRTLAVDDCVLRAPFAGEVSDRQLDPGAFVRPGSSVVSVIDRERVRVVADAPESDFSVVAPGTEVKIVVLATGIVLHGTIARRAPAADDQTRTVRFEIDVPNADRQLPVGTTATLSIDVGAPLPATSVPLRAATQRGDKASLFVVEDGIAKRATVAVLGESGGLLYLDAKLRAGSAVVIEGRALLDEGDHVAAKEWTP